MNIKAIGIIAILIIVVGGVAVYGDVIDPILGNDSSSNSSVESNDSSSNSSDIQNVTSNSTINDTSDSQSNMDQIANDPDKAVDYLNSKGKTQETVTTSDGKQVTLINNQKPKSDLGEGQSIYTKD